MRARVERFVTGRCGAAAVGAAVSLRLEPLHGGLESSVARVTVTGATPVVALPPCFVVKELRPGRYRESDVYRLLWEHLDPPPSPRVLAIDTSSDDHHLYLEDVQAISEWPWSETGHAAAVCRALARLHDCSSLPIAGLAWDYEAELSASAASTLDFARYARDRSGRRHWPRAGDLQRVVAGLPDCRARLLSAGRTVIHGDVHPGNVILRVGGGPTEVALIDWGRARLGSPLEDVASWLHSLGCWEAEARRRHDTLLSAYLRARRDGGVAGTEFRALYALASACNGLAGAIRYHLSVISDIAAPAQARGASTHAVAQWQRVIRRAASLLRTSPAR